VPKIRDSSRARQTSLQLADSPARSACGSTDGRREGMTPREGRTRSTSIAHSWILKEKKALGTRSRLFTVIPAREVPRLLTASRCPSRGATLARGIPDPANNRSERS
jgi:hypothetical protein